MWQKINSILVTIDQHDDLTDESELLMRGGSRAELLWINVVSSERMMKQPFLCLFEKKIVNFVGWKNYNDSCEFVFDSRGKLNLH